MVDYASLRPEVVRKLFVNPLGLAKHLHGLGGEFRAYHLAEQLIIYRQNINGQVA